MNPKVPEVEIPPEGSEVTIDYFVYEIEMILEMIASARYCTQEVTLTCVNSGLEVGGVYGWYSRDGIVQEAWAGNNDGKGLDVRPGTRLLEVQ